MMGLQAQTFEIIKIAFHDFKKLRRNMEDIKKDAN